MNPSLWRRVGLALVLGLLSGSSARAAEIVELTPRQFQGWLVADVRARDLLDARTRSTVESGLPGTVGLSLVVEEEGTGAIAERMLRRDLELDLWEGVAQLREEDEVARFAGLAAADSAWSRFDGVRLIPATSLEGLRRYRVHVELWVRPLGADDRERIARWVSRSETGSRRDVRLDVGRLLAHFVGGNDESPVQGAVRRTTAYFRWGDLLERAPDP